MPHLSLHWLIMRVGFEIAGSKLKPCVNRFNLFKVLIVSSTSFLRGCELNFSSSFSSSPPVITSAGYLENSETIYSTDSGRNWLVPSRKCTSRNVELIESFLVRSIFVKRFQRFILCFLGHIVMLSFCGHSEHNTQAIFFHSLIFKTIKFKNSRKTSKIRTLYPFTVTSRKNNFSKSKFELHDKKSSSGPNNLFDLNDFSNYGSFLIRVYS